MISRFIPTPVGNTITFYRHRRPRSVHPHTRGEHSRLCKSTTGDGGSSPHPWGTRKIRAAKLGKGRFIPTPVGNTHWRHVRMSGRSVHPHTRGEHNAASSPQFHRRGSSPHPWGTPYINHGGAPEKRFIPTPVGNTSWVHTTQDAHAVHPHTRGEHGGDSLSGRRSLGSSPHPWGTRRR